MIVEIEHLDVPSASDASEAIFFQATIKPRTAQMKGHKKSVSVLLINLALIKSQRDVCLMCVCVCEKKQLLRS